MKHGVVPEEAAGELLCNFCQKELLMCRDNNNPRSKYCPLDLFSGDKSRQTCQQCLMMFRIVSYHLKCRVAFSNYCFLKIKTLLTWLY